MKTTTQIATRSSGNVFADAGIPNAAGHLLKAQVVVVITNEIKRRGLNQKQAAEVMGIQQPDVSRIQRGDFAGFGLERLLGLVQKLGRDVEINIPRAPKYSEHHKGRVLVHAL